MFRKVLRRLHFPLASRENSCHNWSTACYLRLPKPLRKALLACFHKPVPVVLFLHRPGPAPGGWEEAVRRPEPENTLAN